MYTVKVWDIFWKKTMTVEACSAYLCMMFVISVNNVVSNGSYIWHSGLCHINFGCVSQLANLNLITKFNLVKGSKCQVYVQSKQPRKPHKAVEARNLAPLDLIHVTPGFGRQTECELCTCQDQNSRTQRLHK
jgi:hypothetical protein